MDELWRLLQVHHFGGQVLATAVVQRDRAILAYCHKQRTTGTISELFQSLVELRELVSQTCLFNVKDTHAA